MRAIDGDRLKRKAQKVATEAWKMKINATVEVILNEFIDWINEAPTIEPQRKKGKWINIREGNRADCDQCGQSGRAWMNFCFDCGADMRAERRTDDND